MGGYKLRDYQQQAVDSAWAFLCNQQGNPVIVLPTGAGKSIVIAELARGAIENGLKVLIVAHRKELLEQNAEKIRSLLPGVPVGIYSAGLKSKSTEEPVVLAGIQSAYKKACDFGARHLVIVDEAHLIPDTDAGMYRTFLADLRVSCPQYRMVGLTATPYRLDSGLIYGASQIFDDVCINVPVGELIQRGYLCPITSQPVCEIDTSKLHRRGGEFIRSEMENVFDAHVVAACEEIVAVANAMGRRKILVFCSGITHADHAAKVIDDLGESVGVVTGETMEVVRGGLLSDFRSGNLRFLVNVDVLTTGFDSPNIDCLAILRATESAGLFAQIVGRGLRLHPDKSDCIVLDFGGNIQRHGPIDSPDYGKRAKREAGESEGPTKECPACSEIVAAGTRICPCGFRFPDPEPNHEAYADTSSPILMTDRRVQTYLVEGIGFQSHTKKGADETAPKTMRVTYQVVPEDDDGNLSAEIVSEWICIEHPGYAGVKANRWWYARTDVEIPKTVEEAVIIARKGLLAETKAIKAERKGKYLQIVDYVLGEKMEPTGFEEVYEDEEIPF